MKRRLSILILLAGVTGVVHAAPAQYLRVSPGSAPAVFLPAEPIELTATLPEEKGGRGRLEIRDFEDRVVFEATWPTQGEAEKRLKADATAPRDRETSPCVFRVQVVRTGSAKPVFSEERPFGRFGVFRAILMLQGRDGETREMDETTFARIRDVSLQSRRPDSPFGMGAYYAMRYTREELAVASQIEQLMGAAWDRDELLWDIVEPEPGKWTWEKTDRAVRAAHEHNILILGLLDYWGKWAKPFTDDGYAAYGAYVKRMVNRYKPGGEFARQEGWTDGYGIRDWEIWNEPATFWSGSGEQFGRLLKVAHEAAKSADPQCTVYFSEAGETFNVAAVRVAGLDSFEGVTPHYYCPPRSPEGGEMDRNMKKTVADFAALGAKGRPFWVSEFGWPSTMDPGQMGEQASYLVRSYVYGFAAGMQKLFWYNFVNDGRDKTASHFGLINREDWTPRFGFGAYAAMVHFLDGAVYRSQIEIVRPARIFVFQKGNGSIAVLWSSGAAGTLTAHLPGRIELYDLMGNARSADSMVHGDGGAVTVPLTANPVYLVAEETPWEELASSLGKGSIQGISPVELRVLPIVGPVVPTLPVRIEIANVGNQPVAGKVRLIPPEGWGSEAKAEFKDVATVAAGTSAVVSFAFNSLRRDPGNRYSFRTVFRDARGNEAEAESVLSEDVAIHGTPAIDGKADDWKDVPFVHLDTPDKAVGLVPYMDWNLSTDFATMWDQSNLYFCGKVRDNVFSEPHSGSNIWEGDSFQIAFDSRPDRSQEPGPDSKGLYLYGLAHTPEGNVAWSWPTPGNLSDRAVPEIQFAFSNHEKDVYVYEASIPKTLLAPMEFKDGAHFGFSLLLNDNDGGGRRGWLELTPGIGTGYQPRQFLEWTLVGRDR